MMTTRRGAHGGADRDIPRAAPAEGAPRMLDEIELAPRAPALIEEARATGGEVVITRRGRPVARLIPLAADDDEGEASTWDVEAVAP